jgi:hypothetical protein
MGHKMKAEWRHDQQENCVQPAVACIREWPEPEQQNEREGCAHVESRAALTDGQQITSGSPGVGRILSAEKSKDLEHEIIHELPQVHV